MLPLGNDRAGFPAAGHQWENGFARGFQRRARVARDFHVQPLSLRETYPRRAWRNWAAITNAKGVAMVGINSNDAANYPADSPAKMKEEVKSAGYTFPVSLRRNAGGGQGLSRRLHAGLFSLRPPAKAGLSRPV